MHIVIANERFLPRFGVDRMLFMIAESLRAEGHRVTMICTRCDQAAASKRSDKLVILDMPPLGLREIDERMSEAVANAWDDIFAEHPPTVFLIGGWPFFSLADVCAARGVATIFGDAGAVPHDGMGENELAGQLELRRLRALSMPRFTSVTPISSFIAKSQTLPERGGPDDVTVIHLGADHLANVAKLPDDESASAMQDVREQTAAGARLAFVLGRWEPSNYKNTAAAFALARIVRQAIPDFFLAVLAQPDEIEIPSDLVGAVIPLGHISDTDMVELMMLADVGLALSLWEGFNLPLAEMQYLERPALAFSIGAHPEVVVDPWFLCSTLDDMAKKTEFLLQNGRPATISGEAYEKFRSKFTWANTVRGYIDEIERVTSNAPPRVPIWFVFDVSNAARDTANSGVVRVTRQLCAAFQKAGEHPLIFTCWDSERGEYRFLWPGERAHLADFGGPKEATGALFSDNAAPQSLTRGLRAAGGKVVFVFPEVVMDGSMGERIAWIRAQQGQAAGILYDLIPINYAEFTSAALTKVFKPYLQAMYSLDAVYGISNFCLSEFQDYAISNGVKMPDRSCAVWLPGQFSSEQRWNLAEKPPSLDINILCVSTLEPRKNHLKLLAAYTSLRERRPDLPLRLHLVGNVYDGKSELAEAVRDVCKHDDTITWHGPASDEVLIGLYSAAAFTVYASIVEGFGLPVLESLWMATPCLCNSSGVMAELAAGGGCMTVDMLDVESLSVAMERLADSPHLRQTLQAEACTREIKTWAGYSAEISKHLLELAA